MNLLYISTLQNLLCQFGFIINQEPQCRTLICGVIAKFNTNRGKYVHLDVF